MVEQKIRIKCNGGPMVYFYWTGVAWTKNILFAHQYRNESEAKKELKSLSPPRGADPKGRGPEVFSM